MKLSAPIYVLKNQAKKRKKQNDLTLNQALNQIAQKEGFNTWSLLMSKQEELLPKRYDELLYYFNPGDLVLIGARPSVGKTIFTTGLFVQSVQKKDFKSFSFSLSEASGDIENRAKKIAPAIMLCPEYFEFNYSDKISADFIIEKTQNSLVDRSLIVIDYLQLLDQKRTNLDLQIQVKKLKSYAKETGAIVVFISQLDRELRKSPNQVPVIADINLPNPLDLSLMNKIILLHRPDNSSVATVILAGDKSHSFKIGWNRKSLQFFDYNEDSREKNFYGNKILDSFLIDGRLSSIPVKRSKRRVILEHILKSFERDRKYTEKEVNKILLNFFNDFCTLRREMVCEKLMDRDNGIYWVIK